MNVLNKDLDKALSLYFYRYRFLICYIFIGFLSIALELLSFRVLERIGITSPLSNIIGFSLGVILAFWMNAKYNFKVPKNKRQRAFFYFCGISLFSVGLNILFKRPLQNMGLSYELARFVASGTLFFIGYLLHRKFSFKDFKKVSVAIYANGVEDVEAIFKKVGIYPDIIHVDIIDHTFGIKDHDTRSYKLEVMKAYWPDKQISVHLMSKVPSQWLDDIVKYANLITIHYEIDEDVAQVLQSIKGRGCRAGLALKMTSDVSSAKQYIPYIDTLMLLTIEKPGFSGQAFDERAIEKIKEINAWPERSEFVLCIDGGVNEKNIGALQVEVIVSGSSVLNHDEPKKQIMRLQTSSNYETS